MRNREEVIAQLKGGLGNQLFIWAAAYSLASRLGLSVALSTAEIARISKPSHPRQFHLDYFGLQPVNETREVYLLKSSKPRNLFGQKQEVFEESGFTFDKRFSQIRHPTALSGYFQSFKYFDGHDKAIRQGLLEGARVTPSALELLPSLPKSWIAVHVRRGDYELNRHVYSLPGRRYYQEAIDCARSIAGNFPVVVFSDDKSAAEECVPEFDFIFSEQEIRHPGDVLYLMSKSSLVVGANSSLSWWGAFLASSKPRPHIFPRPWFANDKKSSKDLLYPWWLTIGVSDD